MNSMLIMFIRALVAELRSAAELLDSPGHAPSGAGDTVRAIASAIESASKRTLLA